MDPARGILLTGATGLLGRYLLRDLLASGQRVAVLVRDGHETAAAERVAEIVAFGSETLGWELPPPVVLVGSLTLPGLGIGTAGRRWLADHCRVVVHAAANVSFQMTGDGEPWETNVNGTRRLLELCRALGLAEVHHVSTAFLCGDRPGVVREDELDCGRGTTNAYEKSKFAAEQLVRQFPGIHATVYRPAVVVGDSRTGYTSSYHHFYRFLELAVRLAVPARPEPASAGASEVAPEDRPRGHQLSLRLPLTGEETQNLVPVDWVSRAVVELLRRPGWHGRTFHLVAREPVRLREIKAIVEDLLHLEGIQWAGPAGAGLVDPTPLEQRVVEQFQDYWSYLHGDLVFDCRNTRAALPDLPPPVFDRDLVARLLRFARDDKWGRRRTRAQLARGPASPREPDCARYMERFLPEQVQRSTLARVFPAGLCFALDIRGPGGGQWSCRRDPGGRIEVRRGPEAGAAVTYRTDPASFGALVRGRQTVQSAFFEGRIEIEGDMETALKLAALIEQFLAESPYPSPQSPEAPYAAA
jgi:nucleoside-diphosphate-sugar epimerase